METCGCPDGKSSLCFSLRLYEYIYNYIYEFTLQPIINQCSQSLLQELDNQIVKTKGDDVSSSPAGVLALTWFNVEYTWTIIPATRNKAEPQTPSVETQATVPVQALAMQTVHSVMLSGIHRF